MSMWGGRFEEGPDQVFVRFNASFPFDRKLVFYDIQGSQAYGQALFDAGVLSQEDFDKITMGLEDLKDRLEANPEDLDQAVNEGYEDVHGYVEDSLSAMIGDAAKRLHTGRSRNDQVATDFRLYTRDAIDQLCADIKCLQETLLQKAEENFDAILPGFTHLQKAQPVAWPHYLLSYNEMLKRDWGRLQDTRKRVNVLPLGSGALAGNNYDLDRIKLAKSLGFDGVTSNSLDATSDRDFVVETISAIALTMVHLSRLAEDLIIYCSSEYSYVEMSDLVATGSSLMPQKKNPDALELIRGKSGRVFGHLTSILSVLKGLPSCYNKDLQEDKEGLFDAVETASISLKVMTTVIGTLKVKPEVMLDACKTGYLNATDLADYLVAQGLAFREAHHVVGEIVLYALRKGVAIEELSLEELQTHSAQIRDDVYAAISLQQSLAAKKSWGGTSPERVREALDLAKKMM
ncbi:argininosuccinate lyase [Pseudobacteriovorax antillogorgiicola]|uniref:Argininosuccinate lyase n=1 Tax=Pseudobacteriovorax antillogorgiicola TaxID=1513793 RepID=A0A1Y6B8V0_9BACT|nr:argininosuccinate lyase [Pseudobacteriovorax antillogorgiicola]TCS58802.1 argininosuccinate lyase [Pseudobacteriovorax antillogorgiicola]SME94544.1 argininosuccinate lyase [Pseudobacteriovorax antillogorgiicola]